MAGERRESRSLYVSGVFLEREDRGCRDPDRIAGTRSSGGGLRLLRNRDGHESLVKRSRRDRANQRRNGDLTECRHGPLRGQRQLQRNPVVVFRPRERHHGYRCDRDRSWRVPPSRAQPNGGRTGSTMRSPPRRLPAASQRRGTGLERLPIGQSRCSPGAGPTMRGCARRKGPLRPTQRVSPQQECQPAPSRAWSRDCRLYRPWGMPRRSQTSYGVVDVFAAARLAFVFVLW
jgi:hypothetical protein